MFFCDLLNKHSWFAQTGQMRFSRRLGLFGHSCARGQIDDQPGKIIWVTIGHHPCALSRKSKHLGFFGYHHPWSPTLPKSPSTYCTFYRRSCFRLEKVVQIRHQELIWPGHLQTVLVPPNTNEPFSLYVDASQFAREPSCTRQKGAK